MPAHCHFHACSEEKPERARVDCAKGKGHNKVIKFFFFIIYHLAAMKYVLFCFFSSPLHLFLIFLIFLLPVEPKILPCAAEHEWKLQALSINSPPTSAWLRREKGLTRFLGTFFLMEYIARQMQVRNTVRSITRALCLPEAFFAERKKKCQNIKRVR